MRFGYNALPVIISNSSEVISWDMADTDGLVLLYVPCGSEDEALRIGRALIEQKLIACANIYPSRSLYRWKGEIADEREHLLLCKTAQSRAEAARHAIGQMHSYDLPCVIRIEPDGVNHEYHKWVVGELYG